MSEDTAIQPFQKEELQLFQKSLASVREEVKGSPYIGEAIKVLQVKGYRSAIGCYWNAVVDDLRNKVIHRSLDLFNKEMNCKPEVKTYEDFQNHVTDHDLIDGAYKIGALDWEARKLLHHARETRNIFDGHPKSTDPSPLKVLDMINDCNKYVLSQEYPSTIINISEYVVLMDSTNYDRNPIAIGQAFSDLPEVYKGELANRFYAIYTHPDSSITLRANVEVAAPILWPVLPQPIKRQVAARFDKEMLSSNAFKIQNGADFLEKVNGLRYVSTATRKAIVEPLIENLETNLDNWKEEGEAVGKLQRLASSVPSDLVPRFVTALTKTYVGYRGYSAQFSRSTFYSDAAAPIVAAMFETFDDNSVRAFVEAVRTDGVLRERIKNQGQLLRLRNLATILLDRPGLPEELTQFLTLVVDANQTQKFFSTIKLKVE